MCNSLKLLILISVLFLFQGTINHTSGQSESSNKEPVAPVFENGEAQIVPEFKDPDYWIREDLWVETEFDSDGDGKPDRMHVDVTRPRQTETEGLKLPVIYETSPYFAGTGSSDRKYLWNVKQELNRPPTSNENMFQNLKQK